MYARISVVVQVGRIVTTRHCYYITYLYNFPWRIWSIILPSCDYTSSILRLHTLIPYNHTSRLPARSLYENIIRLVLCVVRSSPIYFSLHTIINIMSFVERRSRKNGSVISIQKISAAKKRKKTETGKNYLMRFDMQIIWIFIFCLNKKKVKNWWLSCVCAQVIHRSRPYVQWNTHYISDYTCRGLNKQYVHFFFHIPESLCHSAHKRQ